MKQTFREWLRENDNNSKSQIFKDIKETLYIFESFDSHYEIDKIYLDERNRTCYDFKVNKLQYRIFIQHLLDDKIHIGFEKRDSFFSNKWDILGFEKKINNGEIQKLFGTVIYVVRDLYKNNYNYICIYSEEPKKFNIYLKISQQIHNKLLPESTISYDTNTIVIIKKDAESINISDIEKKYLKKKK